MSAELDPTVAKVLDKERPDAEENDDKEDELLDELEADEAALDAFREKRMQQLHDEYEQLLSIHVVCSYGLLIMGVL